MINIIFDTNAARDFVCGVGLEDLEQYSRERAAIFDAKGVKLLLSPLVILELLYHLLDKNDRDFTVSFKAIKAMMLAQEYQSIGGMRELMSPMELLIANEVYHMCPESRAQMYEQWMSIAELTAHGNIDEIPDLRTRNGGTVRTLVDEIEEGFVRQIRDVCSYVETMASKEGKTFEECINTQESEIIIVSYFSRSTYNILMNEGKLPDYRLFSPLFVPYSDETAKKYKEYCQLIKRGNVEIIRRYPAFVRLAKEVLKRIHQSCNQISDEKLKNYVWDIALMFHVNDHTLDREPFRFITSDTAMLKASGVFRNTNNVMSFAEFNEWVNGRREDTGHS